jgi:hypothetical protein
LESDGGIKKAFDDDRYRWICKQQGCRGCFTNPRGFNLLVINEWGQETGIFIPAFLKYGTWESSGVPNIELAMMQLIHSRKALETDPIAYMQELQEFQLLWKVFTIKGSNIFNQDKIAEQLTKLKTMVKKP